VTRDDHTRAWDAFAAARLGQGDSPDAAADAADAMMLVRAERIARLVQRGGLVDDGSTSTW